MCADVDENFVENADCKVTHVAFGVRGDSLNVEELTSKIGIEPTWAFAKGDKFDVRGIVRERPWGVWGYSTENLVKSTSTEKHARYLLDILEPRKEVLKQYTQNKDYRTSVTIWWEAVDDHGGYTMSAETMARLCALCQEIDTTFIAWPEEQ